MDESSVEMEEKDEQKMDKGRNLGLVSEKTMDYRI